MLAVVDTASADIIQKWSNMSVVVGALFSQGKIHRHGFEHCEWAPQIHEHVDAIPENKDRLHHR
jgi:hypothetical protein